METMTNEDGNNDDDDDSCQLTKNCERNDGRSLPANTIVGDTQVSAGVLTTNLNYDGDDNDDNDDGDDDDMMLLLPMIMIILTMKTDIQDNKDKLSWNYCRRIHVQYLCEREKYV